jgi:ssDNA thymidine ADP-ribosyltransferase, DarT
MTPVPSHPKIYHIVHVDRLPSIISNACLWCDAEIVRRSPPGTTIGMNGIKQRRLNELILTNHPNLHVGDCVPFYFCPRSVMLFLISRANHPEMAYHGGQGPIIHIEADLRQSVAWAEARGLRWAYTLSNAGAYYFEDRCSLEQLGEINWPAVQASNWQQCKEGKQAEFLVEQQFPWELVSRIGVMSQQVYNQVVAALEATGQRPRVEIKREWYY